MHPDMTRADLATDGRALRCCGRRFLNLSLRRSRPRATPCAGRALPVTAMPRVTTISPGFLGKLVRNLVVSGDSFAHTAIETQAHFERAGLAAAHANSAGRSPHLFGRRGR